jgi:hypothetical protein
VINFNRQATFSQGAEVSKGHDGAASGEGCTACRNPPSKDLEHHVFDAAAVKVVSPDRDEGWLRACIRTIDACSVILIHANADQRCAVMNLDAYLVVEQASFEKL